MYFFFNDTATTEIYTLSLHDALPILRLKIAMKRRITMAPRSTTSPVSLAMPTGPATPAGTLADVSKLANKSPIAETVATVRSEEHTSELQSRQYLVCRLLLEKKKYQT